MRVFSFSSNSYKSLLWRIKVIMGNSIYTINKAINKSIEFKGLKAQYIWYLGGGIIVLLMLFTIMYICTIHTFICLGTILILGTGWCMYVYRLSNQFGEFGMMKKLAKKSIPHLIKSNSRKFLVARKK